jgi:hypothetical protein
MPRRRQLALFNDECKNFGELRAVIGLARAMALLEWRKRRARVRTMRDHPARFHSRQDAAEPTPKNQILLILD